MNQILHHILRDRDIVAAMRAEQSHEMVIAVEVVPEKKVVMAVRADDWKVVTKPFSWFNISGDGTSPDFTDVEVVDGGFAIRLGKYEVGADAFLHE